MSQSTVRSPNYPAISFTEAITKIKMVYDQETMHPAEKEVIAKAMKYGGLNGSSYTIISALAKYGLLEPVGNQYKVSADAIDIILHRQGDIERVRAIQKLAFMPSLFNELHNIYPDNSPSDASLRAYLAKKGFNHKALDSVIRSYRDTIEFVNEETKGSIAESVDELQEVPMQTQTMKQASPINDLRSAMPVSSQIEKDLGESVVGFKLTEECGARIEFLGEVTQEAIDKLIKHLELSKDAYPKKIALEQKTNHHENEG